MLLKFGANLLSDEQWSKNILNPYHNMLLPKCVSVCAQAWARGRGVCQWRIERETDRSWWLWCELGPQNRETRWKKKSNIIGQMSPCKPPVEECVGFSLCVAGATTRKWLTHTHSCVQMSITKSDEVQSFFFFLQYPQAGQTSDTPLKGSKTAPTTSTFCCILFSPKETCVIRTLPSICSPYVQLLSLFLEEFGF